MKHLLSPAPVITVFLALMLFVAVGVGPGSFGFFDAWGIVVDDLPGRLFTAPERLDQVLVLDLRLPRALLAILLGAALGAAGAVTQGLFRNALAEPSVLGVSMGAAALAVVGFSLGLDAFALWATPLLAAIGAVGALVILFALAGGSRSIVTVLLSGIALSALGSAVITLMLALQIERWELGLKVIAWLMGSFEGRSWPQLGWATLPCAVGLFLAMWLRRDLDLLHLGPETATSLGLDLARTRLLAIICIGVLVGAATAMVGVIGFIGLIVPHLARLLIGPTHDRLVPLSIILGAATLLAVDTSSRMVTSIMLPPGVITSLLGAPFFLWLLRRHDQRGLP